LAEYNVFDSMIITYYIIEGIDIWRISGTFLLSLSVISSMVFVVKIIYDKYYSLSYNDTDIFEK